MPGFSHLPIFISLGSVDLIPQQLYLDDKRMKKVSHLKMSLLICAASPQCNTEIESNSFVPPGFVQYTLRCVLKLTPTSANILDSEVASR